MQDTNVKEITAKNMDLSWIPEDTRYYAKKLSKRVKNDRDIVIGITGEEGSGKSTFMIQLGLAADPNFNVVKNLMYSPSEEETRQKIEELPKYSFIGGDEAIKILYKLRWSSKIQIYLNMLFGVARQENKIVALLMPRFSDFNEMFRGHRIKNWIHVIDRGTAVVFKGDWSPFTKDPWWFNENQKIIKEVGRGRKTLLADIEYKKKLLSKTRNFVEFLHFTDLPENIKNVYLENKAKQKYKGIDDFMEEKSGGKMWKDRFKSVIGNLYYNEKCNHNDMWKKIGMLKPSYYRLVREYAKENGLDTPAELRRKKSEKSRIQRVSIDNVINKV